MPYRGDKPKDTSSGGESEPGYSQRTVRRGVRTGSTKLKPKPGRGPTGGCPWGEAMGDDRAMRWLDGTTTQ